MVLLILLQIVLNIKIMNNPYNSSEMRWFSTKKEAIYNLYKALPSEGNIDGIHQDKRTDYYLKTSLISTSVKIREGRHEIKIMSGVDKIKPFGIIEHWAKWSTSEVDNILNTICEEYRKDWISIKKNRYLKKFAINESNGKVEYSTGFPDDGCGIEYTELIINKSKFYTFGLESFGTHRSSLKNLLDVLKFLNLEKIRTNGLMYMGYPEFIKTKF